MWLPWRSKPSSPSTQSKRLNQHQIKKQSITVSIWTKIGIKQFTQSTDDYRKSAFLFQWLSVLIQRYNAVAVLGTFTHTTPRG